MALPRGTRLGPYEIQAPLGAGGMGEVYKATDTRLGRTVAIKVLPAELASDPERRQRFEREAKTISSLQHPHICTLYDVGHQDGIDFLVMEHLEGETLQDRLGKSALPLDRAVRYGIEIADALDKAHRQGIVHRDLKPGNIMLTKAGARLLDFGLAKLRGPTDAAGGLSALPTQEASLTAKGSIAGTFQYMAPEQLDGGEADARTDIWAFGCVVYEMVTGHKAFEKEGQASLISAIMQDEPRSMTSLQPMSPPALDVVIRVCLAKDPDERWQNASDVGKQLKLTIEGDGTVGVPVIPMSGTASGPGWRRSLAIGLASLLIGALTVWTMTRPALPPVTRTSIVLSQGHIRTNTEARGLAISPAGTHVVYVANDQLYMRALDELEARPIAGTEGSRPWSPVFSPDGQWVAFFSERDGDLEKVAVSGGALTPLVEFPSGPARSRGASWGQDDTIVFSRTDPGERGIHRVPASGGTPDLLVAIDPPYTAHYPQILPGREALLYTRGTFLAGWDNAQIVVEHLGTGERTILIEGGTDARYLSTGHLMFARGNTILAAPLDVDRLTVTGQPVPLVDRVSRASLTGSANIDVSRTGQLVYLPGKGIGESLRTIVWVDRDGTEEPLAIPPRDYVYPRLSPDGTRIALDARDDEDDLWVWDLERETLTRLTFGPQREWYPVWTPDSERILFASARFETGNFLFWRAADGTGAIEPIRETTQAAPNSITPDGTRTLITTEYGLAAVTLDDERRLEPLIEGDRQYASGNGEVSPDGKWLAYQSSVSGRYEVYVQPFPEVDAGRWQISTAGGTAPLWSPDGTELFYLTGADVMGVSIETDTGFEPSVPRLIVQGRSEPPANIGGRTYDISRDGQRFLMLKDIAGEAGGPAQIVVVQNWYSELQRLVPMP